MDIEKQNINTVIKFFKNFSSGEVASTMAMMRDDVTWWVAGTTPISGTYTKAEFTELLTGVLDSCNQPIKITPITFTAQDDRVAVEAESYTETNTGKIYNNFYHFLIRVNNGKIVSVKEYLDTMHANQLLCT